MSINEIVNNAIAKFILYLQGVILEFLGKTLAQIAILFSYFLKAQGNYFKDITIVQTSWSVFRDFANMFFILILIIIAFATIFDLQNYNWKGLMAKFLIAALLINFSLVIGQFVINIATTLSNVMLHQFSDITGNLAGGFGLNSLASLATKNASSSPTIDAEKAIVGAIISSAGMIILVAVVLMSLLAAFIFSIVRIPILWALLIVSPLAWIAGILPATRKWFNDWKKYFIAWTFFLPFYLFVLVIGIAILQNRPDLEAATRLSGGNVLERAGNLFGFAAQNLFFYILTVVILVGGLMLSLKASFLAGTGVNQTMGFVSGKVQDFARVSALKKVGKEKWAEIQEKGLTIKGRTIYGKRAEELREAKMRERFGLKEDAYSRELREQRRQDIEKYLKDYLDRNLTQADIAKLLATETDQNKILALRKINADKGWVPRGPAGVREVQNTVKIFGENTKEAQEYIASLVKHNFEDMAGSALEMQSFVLDPNTGAELKKAALQVMAKRGDLGELQNEKLFTMTRDLFSNATKPERDGMDADLIKNFNQLDQTRVDALIASGKMSEDQVLDLLERRVEKNWLPSGTAGEKEILDTIGRLGGESTQRSKKYMDTLIKFDFMNGWKQTDKENLVKNKTLPQVVRNAGLEVMAKNNDLISDELIELGLKSLVGQVKEKRDRIYGNLKKNIKSVYKNKPERETFLLDKSKPQEKRKLLAETMLDDGELDTYTKYREAEELFGGEEETLSRNALSKLAQENQIIHAETEWRKERTSTTGDDRFVKDPGFLGSAADRALLKTSFAGRLQKMNAQKIADLNKDSWQLPEFESALQKKVSDLQTIDGGQAALRPYRPAEPAISPGGVDRRGKVYPSGRAAIPAIGDPAYPKGRKAVPGAGERLKENITRLIAGNNDKTDILRRVVV